MKNKAKEANRIPEIHLHYLFDIATKFNYENLCKSKCKIFMGYSNKIQYPLRTLKRIICKKCKTFLIPKLNCTAQFIKKQNGFGFETKCNKCNERRIVVKRGI
jgi:RNase P subunit RPR2